MNESRPGQEKGILLYPPDERIAPIERFQGQSIISARQFTLGGLQEVCNWAKELKGRLKNRWNAAERLRGYTLATLFYEPSTRTRFMFEVAMQILGGNTVTETDVRFSSRIKGESLEHTVRVVSGMTDGVVLRDPKAGSVLEVLPYAVKPLFNGGDGDREHPFQALKDYYTILDEFGQIDGRSFTLIGDLRFGRTVHSLAYFLSLHKGIRVNLGAPPDLQAPEEMIDVLKRGQVELQTYCRLGDLTDVGDIIYVTRVQSERIKDPTIKAKIEAVAPDFTITEAFTERFPHTKIMHPLPIGSGEIVKELDSHPNSIYFKQSDNGVLVTAALLLLVLKGGW